ncbi:MAG: phosphonate ABC transporter, permease protein PhnE [Anaerolineales bacterium]|nr:phosphonate ABC transporter, permease protein PhnE [Anaerolineales bacterium]
MTIPKLKTNDELKPSLVPPVVASLVSFIIPGSGHALARSIQRGVLLFLSFLSILGLLVWRIKLVGRREEEIFDIVKKAYHLEPVLLFASILFILVYIFIVFDAYRFAARTARPSLGPFLLILLAFFALGLQIGEIDLAQFIREIGDARFRLTQIMWPWESAISRASSEVVGVQDIKVPCDENPPRPSDETALGAWLISTPTCGDLSQQDGTPGTTLSIIGGNLAPNSEAAIIWEDPLGNEFRQRQEGEYVTVLTDETGGFELEVIMPYRLVPSSAAEGSHIWRIKARQLSETGAIEPSRVLILAVTKIIETIFLGMMATFFGIIFALPTSFLAARNLMSTSWITLAIYFIMRTLLNIVRSVEPLIWAVIAVAVVGLGPFAGIIALTLHSIAALGKLYSEAIESIDPGPIEAIQATGANWLQIVIYAVIPQIIPPFVSFTIYRWDINVRMSTVLGLVGGGGIGYLLVQWMRINDFKAAGIAVWFIVITVTILDFVSSEIRQRFV